MKLCVAQTRPFNGDIAKNIERHVALIRQAAAEGARMIMFPELSITGYEPALAPQLATHHDDERFTVFRQLCETNKIGIAFGYPCRKDQEVAISMAIIEPGKPNRSYSKQYLHSSEEPFFTSRVDYNGLIGPEETIAPAICYELSVPEHAAAAANKGAHFYMLGVVEDEAGAGRAIAKLSATARRHSMTVLMANCTGPTGNYLGGGNSSVISQSGELIASLDAHSEGILVYDTETRTCSTICLGEELVK